MKQPNKNKRLNTLRAGDAFKFKDRTYIALMLVIDPFNVYCLDVLTKTVVEIDESEMVELLNPWQIRFSAKAERGKKKLGFAYR